MTQLATMIDNGTTKQMILEGTTNRLLGNYDEAAMVESNDYEALCKKS